MKQTTMQKIDENLSYEEAFTELEKMLQQLEAGDLPLEDALALYEKGAALSQYCSQKLDAAELRVSQWQSEQE